MIRSTIRLAFGLAFVVGALFVLAKLSALVGPLR